MKIKYLILLNILILNYSLFSQETLPIYTDYLTDNIYLLHPAGAGISDFGKIRLTGRKQWLNYKDAPELQTLSFHTHLGNNVAIGSAAYKDSNGHFSQAGGQLTFAYHISLDNIHTHQFSFAISTVATRNTLDTSNFNQPDSDVIPQIKSINYFNVDIGFAYRNQGFFSFYTTKNIFKIKRELFYNQLETDNIRRHLLTLGFQINEEHEKSIKFQPSILAQYIEKTKEIYLDANLKIFVPFENGDVWGGLSFRKGFDNNSIESPNFLTPFLGINYNNFVISYSYASQQNQVVYSNSGFHQITLGYNIPFNRYSRSSTWDL